MSLLIIDNKDSFTFNLLELFRSVYQGDITVLDYDAADISAWKEHRHLVISPGPGLPEDFPKYREWIAQLGPDQALLGVCMGHEIIACYFGGKLRRLDTVSHGTAGILRCTDPHEPMFFGLEDHSEVGLYHSWIVTEEGFPGCLEVTATDDKGRIMALRHRELDIRSVQFHPESYITKTGKTMMKNWLFSHDDKFT